MNVNDNSILAETDKNEVSPGTMMSPGHSPNGPNPPGVDNRTQFFEGVDEQAENDFMKRLLDNTVHGTCHVPGMCNGSLEDQLDVFMVRDQHIRHSLKFFIIVCSNYSRCFPLSKNCRQPLSMFSFFRDEEEGEAVRVQVLPAGAYVLPTYCEYCKASNGCPCQPHCERPKLYFQKKRPPFRKLDPNRWNPQTDFALGQEEMMDDDSVPDSPMPTCKDVASLASTSASSSNNSTTNNTSSPTTFPDLNDSNESYDSLPRHSWLGLFAARPQPVAN